MSLELKEEEKLSRQTFKKECDNALSVGVVLKELVLY